MSTDVNVQKGRDLVLLARNDDDTAWQLLGGVKTTGFSFDNPVEDTTSSSTRGDYTESEYTGYSTVTLNISGVADKRAESDTLGGVTYAGIGAERLLELATTGQRCGKFKMINVDSDGFIEGEFQITNFSKTGDTPGLLSFDATLQSRSSVTVQGAV